MYYETELKKEVTCSKYLSTADVPVLSFYDLVIKQGLKKLKSLPSILTFSQFWRLTVHTL